MFCLLLGICFFGLFFCDMYTFHAIFGLKQRHGIKRYFITGVWVMWILLCHDLGRSVRLFACPCKTCEFLFVFVFCFLLKLNCQSDTTQPVTLNWSVLVFTCLLGVLVLSVCYCCRASHPVLVNSFGSLVVRHLHQEKETGIESCFF